MDNNHHFPLQQFITNEGLKHLAEEIFSYLDVKSLAKCRLVCYSWKCVIDQNRHWWILHLKNLRKNPKLFVDVYMWKNHVIRQSRALFLDRFPTWTSTFDYFENEAKIQKLEEFVSYFHSVFRQDKVFTALGQCPIFESISKGTQDSLRFLEFMLTFSPFDFNSTGYFELLDFTPFAWAVKLGRIDFVRVFIENAKACGIDLNKGPRKCSFQFTPLHAACWNGNPEIVRLLLDNAIEHGIHLGAGGPHQLTPLHTAIALHKFPITLTERECPLISHKKKEVVSILLQHPVAQAHINYNASSCANRHNTALHFACFYGLTGVVQLLIEHAERLSIDLNSTDAYGRRPIDLAIEYNNNIEIIQLFTMLDAK